MSVLAFINKLKTYGFGDTRVLRTTYGCPGRDGSTQKSCGVMRAYLKQPPTDDVSHDKNADKHRAKSGANGL